MPTTRPVHLAIALGLLAIAVPSAALAQAAAVPLALAPHRAVYEITLDQARAGTSVSEMSGRMVYELTGSVCDGYTQTMRFVTRMTNQEGATSLTDMRSTSWEDAVAKAFRFQSSQYKDTKLEDQTQGDASREKFEGEGKVEITRPNKKQMPLKGSVYFPIQHSIALLTAAHRGDPIFQADLYDGSEKGEKVYTTTAYIGRPQAPGQRKELQPAANGKPLDALRSWPISISYFEQGAEKKDALPVYELAFQYFENGVSSLLFIDYVDFAVRGTLKDITFLEPTKCDAKPKP